jgi:hypothetical protein
LKKVLQARKEVRMTKKSIGFFVVALLVFAVAALGDWDPGDPRKWVQYPDLTNLGIDVNASRQLILADDFRCTESGYINSIHIWGSWLWDYPPFGMNPDSVRFILSIHADIPDSVSSTGYSMPDTVLWYRDFLPGAFGVRIWKEGILEAWLDPRDTTYIFPADSICWQYNFHIPPDETFYQQGTSDEPITYWLDVKAVPFDPEAVFGWKTSRNHWNDDAVWGRGSEPYNGPWEELRYPPNHELHGQSIDLAFVIVGEVTEELDWGDAIDTPFIPLYPTLAANNGANHIIGGPWLGDNTDSPDPEGDGQPHPNALGDDNDGNDDEDGVQIPVLVPGRPSTIMLEVNGGGGNVVAWIDFNGDRMWVAAEQIFSGWLAAGNHSITITTPTTAVLGQTFARFRISTVAGLPPDGPAQDGEVEDYEVYIVEQVLKWIQRPDLSEMGIDINVTEPFILADDFQCTGPGRITEIGIWASWLNDYLPFGFDPRAVTFTLSFHSDIPDSLNPDGYSIPGNPLWVQTFPPGTFSAVVFRDSIIEGWMNPPDDYWPAADFTCWFYKFPVDPYEAFFQRGTPWNPRVYWLDIQAEPDDPDATIGWKTSYQHWNDDGVWGMGSEPYLGPWYELRYPPDHEYYPNTIDLAFRLITDPESGVPSRDTDTEGFGLYQNVPNPFTSTTVMRYGLPAGGGHVKLEVFNVTGRLVRTLVDEVMPSGMHTITWSGCNDAGRELPAGIYFQRLTLGDRVSARKMLLLK